MVGHGKPVRLCRVILLVEILILCNNEFGVDFFIADKEIDEELWTMAIMPRLGVSC